MVSYEDVERDDVRFRTLALHLLHQSVRFALLRCEEKVMYDGVVDREQGWIIGRSAEVGEVLLERIEAVKSMLVPADEEQCVDDGTVARRIRPYLLRYHNVPSAENGVDHSELPVAI
ncbi:hypothetical protein GSI_06364 [Ganoderma sinense ZZ0214-1]|uniref:Uncharacterized protein n=1 Tax=Ganoderma sinense ZZ0214-1 TaxID=1077348 RepID=A0A2G8SD40_9APHY|nr:hypothetical protein GSI_06364 [Ganoderma sinense ZZ0214-1]